MMLLVDAGNQRLKWALGDATGQWQDQGVVTVEDSLVSKLTAAWSDLQTPRRIVVSSVAGGRAAQDIQAVSARWKVPVNFIKPSDAAFGVRNAYEQPDQLGSDRWASMIGARELDKGALCVVDCGTAVTVDALAADGTMVGGVIFPGLAMARRALREHTAGIGAPEAVAEAGLRSRGTAQAVAAGTLYGTAAAVDRFVAEYFDELGSPTTAYLTGGDAPVLAPHLKMSMASVPDLVLRGLAVIGGAS